MNVRVCISGNENKQQNKDRKSGVGVYLWIKVTLNLKHMHPLKAQTGICAHAVPFWHLMWFFKSVFPDKSILIATIQDILKFNHLPLQHYFHCNWITNFLRTTSSTIIELHWKILLKKHWYVTTNEVPERQHDVGESLFSNMTCQHDKVGLTWQLCFHISVDVAQ